ncbi:hypothetical protein SCA6_004854 [Theobroma cacao]
MEQLEPQLAKKHLWPDQDEEDEEEEAGVGLLARHSRHPNNGVGTTPTSTATTISGEPQPAPAAAHTNVTTSELPEQEPEGEEQEAADNSQRDEELGDENGEDKVVKEEGDGVTNSFYFHKLQGIWKCRHCNWTHRIGSPCILDVQWGYLHMVMNSPTLNQWGPCFTLETKSQSIPRFYARMVALAVGQMQQAEPCPWMKRLWQAVLFIIACCYKEIPPFPSIKCTESVNGVSEMQSEISKGLSTEINHQQFKNVEDRNFFRLSPALVEQSHEETNTSFKHFDNATKVDANVDLIGEIEEDLMELDVERVLEKQNTHDLYCPNCNSCITRRVILHRRKPKISNICHKPKHVKKLNPIPISVVDGRGGNSPKIYSNDSPTLAPGVQNNSTEQEAFSCLSCFSLFIPIGNGCFKIFQFFGRGKQNENTQNPQEINQSENTQSPQEISQKDIANSPKGISQNEKTESPQKLSHIEDTQNTRNPPMISQSENTQSPQKINGNEITHSPQNINQNESKQSPQNIPKARTSWIFSVFAFHKGKATVDKAGHASSVQGAAVPTLSVSVTSGEHVDDAIIKPKEPGKSNIFSSTKSPLFGKVKAKSREKKLDAGMLNRNSGDNEIEDIEAGPLEPTWSSRTEVGNSSQTGNQNGCGDDDAGEAHEWEILKSIVYGGLIESITSLGVVSSAAGAGADTLNVLALGLANLIGGLIIISHSLRELKNDKPPGASTEVNVEDRYQVVLGRRQNFVLHVTVAILSFLIFGLVPPIVYGFSFRKSDDKDLKLAAVAGASLVCIILLALGKGHVRKPHRAYFRTVSYYVALGFMASGISYVAGELIKKLLEKLGLFESTSAVSAPFLETIPLEVGRASY